MILGLWMLSASLLLAQPVVTSLRTDYKTNPLGIDNPSPGLSWKIESEKMNTMQDSYEIRAALDETDLKKGKNLVWESGKVGSSQSIHVKYGGPFLKSFQRIYWQVKIRDNHGKASKWSQVAWWETGLMPGTGWEAKWITPTWLHLLALPWLSLIFTCQ